MRRSLLFTLLIASLLTSCTLTQDFPSAAGKTEGPPLPEAIQQQKTAWLNSLNEGSANSLEKYYWDRAGLLWGRNYFQDARPVSTQWENLQPGLGTLVEQRTSAVVQQDDQHYLELGYYKFSEKDPTIYAYATAWKAVDGNWLRELEVVQLLFEQQAVDARSIDQAREKWVERSNAHDHEKLVNQSYMNDAYYVNQGQHYQGTEAISEKYRYMSQPNWKIQLTDKAVMKVQDDLAFELGQYESNGVGHYLIVWEKQGNDWKVLLDFNF
jgi:ketosteroid isomerase-like protein